MVTRERGHRRRRGARPPGRRRALLTRFRRAVSDGDLSASDNPDDLAHCVMTVGEGLAVHAVAGSRADLRRVVDVAMQAVPAPRS
ncbi:hypothetical protein AB0F91_42090 [Amycolatopsis sp. NPDC023774]|uniref:hypothetical protein n=1 Tax=Amycolatopsis sp. NPDC023774 TaxID=3155015 RepID=UPI003406B4E0